MRYGGRLRGNRSADAYKDKRPGKPAAIPSCLALLKELDIPGHEAQHRYILNLMSKKDQRKFCRELLVTRIFQRSARSPWARAAARMLGE